MFQYLGIEQSGAVGHVTLRRPPVNAVSQAMYEEIRELFGRTDDVFPRAKVLILAGEGRHFCGGNDLEEFGSLSPENSPDRMKLVREAFWAIYDCPVPVIAAVRGAALGTGLAIAASCDFILCGEGARLGTPEVGVGVMGGAKHLARLLPEPIVRLMYYTAEPWPAAELLRLGAVLDVVPDDKLPAAALELAERIARHCSVALRHAKESLNSIEFMDLKSGYEFEQGLTARLCGFPDAKEALQAVIERRPPRYTDQWLTTGPS